MGHDGKTFKFGAVFVASSIILSSTAYAAPSYSSSVDPLVSLSVFGTSSSRAAVCAAGVQAASTAAVAGAAAAVQAPPGAGCVLPVLDSVAAPMVPDPGVEMASVGGGGLGLVPILVGAAAVGGLAYLLLRKDDDDDINTPVSPD